MLELRNVYKELAGKQVLRGVSFTVERGKTQVVVGSSGAGKSVTLQHIVGLLEPDSGSVFVDGLEVHARKQRQLQKIREKCGMLFQSGALINWMNIFDNIALPLREKTSMTEKQIVDRVHEALALVELDGVDGKMPGELSGGMRKRAGLARAIVNEPALILYDEPTSGLDPVLSRSIDRLIVRLQKELNATSVVVTHDLKSAFAVADSVAMLHDGEIRCNCPPAEFKKNTDPVVSEFVQAQMGRD